MNIRAYPDLSGAAPRDSRFVAIDDDTYDGPGSPQGFGATEAEAIEDLLAQLAEKP